MAARAQTNGTYDYQLQAINQTYTSNGRNQYTQVAGTGGATLGWDANGNLTSDGFTTFGYDTENRLTSATGAKTATLTYDPMGRLYQVSNAAGTTRFLYDGDRLILEYNASGVVQRRYVHGVGVDEPMVWYEGSTVSSATRRYLHADHQGSIIATANAAGTKLDLGTYDAYGVTTAPSTWRFQYTGQTAIQQVGLYYYKARFYNPALGRFMQTDPIGYEDDLDLYSYVYNDPANRVDPDGTHSCANATICPDIPPASSAVASASVQAAAPMKLSSGGKESGAVVYTDAASGQVTRTAEGDKAGNADRAKGSNQFNLKISKKTTEKVGATVHSHPPANRSGAMGMAASSTDASNEYPSSTDLQGTMNQTSAPVVVKTPSGAVREAYRMGGVDHLRTLQPSSATLGPVPRDIKDNFVVDPE